MRELLNKYKFGSPAMAGVPSRVGHMISTYVPAIILAFASSVCFAGNRAFASRPLVNSDPAILTYLTLLTGVLVTGGASALADQLGALLSASGFVVLIFAAVGIAHYALGRQLSYVAVKNIGANTTSPLLATAILYSLIFAVLFLHESVTLLIGVGAALIFVGVVFLEPHSSARKRRGRHNYGYVAGLLTGGIFGLTPIAISFGLSIYNYSVAATFIAYASATVAYTLAGNVRRIIRGVAETPRSALAFYILSSVFAASAQLLRFGALSYAPVVLVAPILSTNPIFTILLTSRTAREVEAFTRRTILSVVIVIIGAALVSISSPAIPAVGG